MSNPVFTIRNLAISYANKVALRPSSLNISEYSITACVGPSGSGKTSFLLSLNRLLELEPKVKVTGDILFNGSSIFAAGVDFRMLRRRIGTIFQKPFPFPVSIFNNIAIGLKELGITNKAELRDRIEKALRDCTLWDEVSGHLDDNGLSLSGGQQQRLCLARALALEPTVLLMDEPCSSLDPHSTAKIEDLLLQLKSRMSIILVTHNLAQAKRISDQLVVFWNEGHGGELIESGPSEKLWQQPSSKITKDYLLGFRG